MKQGKCLSKRKPEIASVTIEANIYAKDPVIKEAVIIPSKLVQDEVPVEEVVVEQQPIVQQVV